MCVRQCVWTLCISITKCGHIESMSYCLHPRFLHERPVTLSKGSWPRISSRWVALWAVWWVIWPSFRSGRCHGWRMVKEKDRKEAEPSAPKTIWGWRIRRRVNSCFLDVWKHTSWMSPRFSVGIDGSAKMLEVWQMDGWRLMYWKDLSLMEGSQSLH
jgi:hypothetical protein